MADLSFCDSNVPDYVNRECGIDYAGIVGIGLIKDDQNPTDADLEDDAWWTAEIAASPQSVYVIQNTRGEYNGGTATEQDGFGLQATVVTGADHTATVEVEGLIENRDFWEGVNRRKWKVALITAGGLMYYVDVSSSVYAKINNAKSTKAMAFWSVDIKWQSFSNPKVLNAPEGIFV
jgi:hypothetical protein